MVRTIRPSLLLLLAALALPALSAPATACPFCSMQGQTLAGEVAGADMVLFGSLTNANVKDETTDLALDSIIKSNPLVAGKKVVTLPKYLDPMATGQYKFLVFCYVFKGKIDPYRGMAMKPESDIVAYLKGVQEIKDKKAGERLKFFFNYLDNADPEITMDAFKEFVVTMSIVMNVGMLAVFKYMPFFLGNWAHWTRPASDTLESVASHQPVLLCFSGAHLHD